jgi:hypothetical protein
MFLPEIFKAPKIPADNWEFWSMENVETLVIKLKAA